MMLVPHNSSPQATFSTLWVGHHLFSLSVSTFYAVPQSLVFSVSTIYSTSFRPWLPHKNSLKLPTILLGGILRQTAFLSGRVLTIYCSARRRRDLSTSVLLFPCKRVKNSKMRSLCSRLWCLCARCKNHNELLRKFKRKNFKSSQW